MLLELEVLVLLVLQTLVVAVVAVVVNHLRLIDKAVVELEAQVSSSSRSINKRSHERQENNEVLRH